MKTITTATVTFSTADGEKIEGPMLDAHYEVDREVLARLIEDLEMSTRLEVADDEALG